MSEIRACIRCPAEYEAKYWEVMGMRILRGSGNCPDCCVELQEEAEAKEKAKREAEIKNTRGEQLSKSGIPQKFKAHSFETFDKGWQDKALSFCEQYANEYPIERRPLGYPSLYLWSRNSWGVGKTHLSCAIAVSIISRWAGTEKKGCPRIYFVSEPDLFRQIQATFSYSREEERARESEGDIIKRLTYCDLLILDDVGKEKRADSRFIQRTLFGLIDGRYKLELPMILTANVDGNGLKTHLEDASFDRFFSMIQGRSACLDGQSYRRKEYVTG